MSAVGKDDQSWQRQPRSKLASSWDLLLGRVYAAVNRLCGVVSAMGKTINIARTINLGRHVNRLCEVPAGRGCDQTRLDQNSPPSIAEIPRRRGCVDAALAAARTIKRATITLALGWDLFRKSLAKLNRLQAVLTRSQSGRGATFRKWGTRTLGKLNRFKAACHGQSLSAFASWDLFRKSLAMLNRLEHAYRVCVPPLPATIKLGGLPSRRRQSGSLLPAAVNLGHVNRLR